MAWLGPARLLARSRPGLLLKRGLSSSENQTQGSLLGRYVRRVLDNPLPIGAGALVVGILQWKRIRERSKEQVELEEKIHKVYTVDDWQIATYKYLPLRTLSRAWGAVNSINLPVAIRPHVLGKYARTFGCDMTEAEEENFEKYANLGEFFRRKLKVGARPLCATPLLSPCDGLLINCGTVDQHTGQIHQVKGVTFSLRAFLGSYFASPLHAFPAKAEDVLAEEGVVSPALTLGAEMPSRLHFCVLYLAPGDYHGFHSPVDWKVTERRHFPGELLSVNPFFVNCLSGLFHINERVALLGEWEHGFFSMTAVGATNVGSIKIEFDEELSTNERRPEMNTFFQKSFQERPVELKRGDRVGEFNLGSSIVLVFEAPEDFSFGLKPGDRVLFGKGLAGPHEKGAGALAQPAAAATFT